MVEVIVMEEAKEGMMDPSSPMSNVKERIASNVIITSTTYIYKLVASIKTRK